MTCGENVPGQIVHDRFCGLHELIVDDFARVKIDQAYSGKFFAIFCETL